jgi:hypothetical protein
MRCRLSTAGDASMAQTATQRHQEVKLLAQPLSSSREPAPSSNRLVNGSLSYGLMRVEVRTTPRRQCSNILTGSVLSADGDDADECLELASDSEDGSSDIEAELLRGRSASKTPTWPSSSLPIGYKTTAPPVPPPPQGFSTSACLITPSYLDDPWAESRRLHRRQHRGWSATRNFTLAESFMEDAGHVSHSVQGLTQLLSASLTSFASGAPCTCSHAPNGTGKWLPARPPSCWNLNTSC